MQRLTLFLLVSGLSFVACGEGADYRASAASEPAVNTAIERGAYLVEGLLQCFVCHSERDWSQPGAPPVEGRVGAGLVWSDSDGRRMIAPNLTPDMESGIGRRTDEQLARAIRRGIGPDGRRLHPAMYYGTFRHLSDAEVSAVIAYLRSREPVYNPLAPTALPAEEQAALDARPPVELRPLDLAHPDPVERGRNLVLVADCHGCHTAWAAPRTPGIMAGGNRISRDTASAFSTNLTPHASGIPYGPEAFVEVMRTGKQGSLHGLMPWVVFRNMDDEDLRAIHVFLQTLYPFNHHVGNNAEPTACEVCGQEHGLGAMNRLERPPAADVPPESWAEYGGTYRSDEFGFEVTVWRESDRLLYREGEGEATELIPQSATRFVPVAGLSPVRFVVDPLGTAKALVLEEIEELRLRRVEPQGDSARSASPHTEGGTE